MYPSLKPRWHSSGLASLQTIPDSLVLPKQSTKFCTCSTRRSLCCKGYRCIVNSKGALPLRCLATRTMPGQGIGTTPTGYVAGFTTTGYVGKQRPDCFQKSRQLDKTKHNKSNKLLYKTHCSYQRSTLTNCLACCGVVWHGVLWWCGGMPALSLDAVDFADDGSIRPKLPSTWIRDVESTHPVDPPPLRSCRQEAPILSPS